MAANAKFNSMASKVFSILESIDDAIGESGALRFLGDAEWPAVPTALREAIFATGRLLDEAKKKKNPKRQMSDEEIEAAREKRRADKEKANAKRREQMRAAAADRRLGDEIERQQMLRRIEKKIGKEREGDKPLAGAAAEAALRKTREERARELAELRPGKIGPLQIGKAKLLRGYDDIERARIAGKDKPVRPTDKPLAGAAAQEVVKAARAKAGIGDAPTGWTAAKSKTSGGRVIRGKEDIRAKAGRLVRERFLHPDTRDRDRDRAKDYDIDEPAGGTFAHTREGMPPGHHKGRHFVDKDAKHRESRRHERLPTRSAGHRMGQLADEPTAHGPRGPSVPTKHTPAGYHRDPSGKLVHSTGKKKNKDFANNTTFHSSKDDALLHTDRDREGARGSADDDEFIYHGNTKRDPRQKWYRVSKEGGYASAMASLGKAYHRDVAFRNPVIKKAMSTGFEGTKGKIIHVKPTGALWNERGMCKVIKDNKTGKERIVPTRAGSVLRKQAVAMHRGKPLRRNGRLISGAQEWRRLCKGKHDEIGGTAGGRDEYKRGFNPRHTDMKKIRQLHKAAEKGKAAKPTRLIKQTAAARASNQPDFAAKVDRVGQQMRSTVHAFNRPDQG